MSNMVVQTNVLALNSHRYMKQVGQAQSKSSARLSSGYKINSAADDAAGLAISEKMRAQIRGLDQASKNAQDGISLIQTAEGGMQEIDNMLQRIRELVVSVSNDTNENNTLGTGDRQKMQDEIDQLVAEIDSMSERVEFNKKKVINGSYADTALQLRNATAEYDRSSLAKVETNAKLSAYKDALGATDDLSNPAGATAYSRLNATQDKVDAEVDPYTAALKTYTAAEVIYKEAQSAYQTARQTMEDQLSKANKKASEITDAMLKKEDAVANFGKDFDFDSFARAFEAYQEASNTWGIEELGFVDKTTGVSNITIGNALTKTEFTGAATADAALATAKGLQADYDKALTAALADTDAAEYLTADPGAELKVAYETAKTNLQTVMPDMTIAGKDITADQKAALIAYASAADDYGIDELDIANKAFAKEETLTNTAVIPTTASATTPSGMAAEFAKLTGTADTDVARATAMAAVNTYLAVDASGTLRQDYLDAKDTLTALVTAGKVTLDATDQSSSGNGNITAEVADAIANYVNAAKDYGIGEDDDGTLTSVRTLLGVANNLNDVNSENTVSASITVATDIYATTAAAATATDEGHTAFKTLTATTTGAVAADANIKIMLAADAGTTPGLDDMAKLYSNYSTAFAAITYTNQTSAVINADAADTWKLADYATKADAWGFDGKNIPTLLAGPLAEVSPAAGTVPATAVVTTPTTDSPAALYAGLSDKTLIDDVVDAKLALNASGAYGKFQIEKETFTAAEAKYKDLVAKRDAAQETVNTLTNSVESTEKEKTRTDMLYNVANAKLDTAKNAVEADDSQALYFQVGANAMQGLEMSIGSVKSDVLGIGDGNGVTNIDVVKDTGLDTTALLDVLDTALSYVTTERSRLGAAQNRLEYTIKSLDISSENLSAAESRIRDTDMAKEMMELTKANTLQQASISMLAQANQAPQSVLQLLG